MSGNHMISISAAVRKDTGLTSRELSLEAPASGYAHAATAVCGGPAVVPNGNQTEPIMVGDGRLEQPPAPFAQDVGGMM